MDVEGAEYDLLNKMIDEDSISYINKLSIEWHNTKCGVDRREDKRLEKVIGSKKIIIDNKWGTLGY